MIPDEVTLIFHSDKDEDRKIRAYVETITGVEINVVDLKIQKLSEEELTQLANKLDLNIVELFDPIHASEAIEKGNILKTLSQNPMLLSTPIIVIGEHAYQFESSSELIIERRNEE